MQSAGLHAVGKDLGTGAVLVSGLPLCLWECVFMIPVKIREKPGHVMKLCGENIK